MKSKAIIIDGHNFLFRGFYGVPVQVKRVDGTPINAVYGFFSLLRTILNDIKPQYLVVVFDSETAADNKKKINQEYKANRAPQDNSIFFQLSIIKKCLDIMGIFWIEDKKNEADDIIGTYSEKFKKQKIETYICSNDHDFMQLVCDKIFVIRGYRGRVDIYNSLLVFDKFNVTPSQYVEYLSLVGDPSDNIKGIKGIGKKIASDILLNNMNITNMFKSIDSLSFKYKKFIFNEQQNFIKRRRFLEISSNLKLKPLFKLEKYLLSNKVIPDKMGNFLNVNWDKII